jgi:hypothetical protein
MNQTLELWKTIDGYTDYQVSNMGNVRNANTHYLIKTNIIGEYKTVFIYGDTNGKQKRMHVHYLVAKTFIENDDLINKHKVDHINNIKTDNRQSNLIWVAQIGDMHNHIEGEEWKTIEGYNRYEVSSMGRIKVKKSGLIMTDHINGGYNTIKLTPNGENKKERRNAVHILVANAFIINDDQKTKIQVDHIDHNKRNNKASNLRWITPSGNIQHYIDNSKIYIERPIIQYDLNYNKIKEWNDIKYILEANPTYKYSTVMRNLKNYSKSYGFYWKFKGEAKEVEFEDDEIFKRIGKFDNWDLSNYAVSNYGKVMNISRKAFLTPGDKHGYMCVLLYPNNKRKNFRINRLVAFAFVDE